MVTGFYLMYRGWMENDVFRREPFTDREAWVFLIEKAYFSTSKFSVNNRLYDIPRGALPTSYRRLMSAWGWGQGRVAGFLAKLKNAGMLDTRSDTPFLLIRIIKYEEYQSRSDTHPDTPLDTQPDTQSDTHNKQVKEGKTINSILPKPKKEKRNGLQTTVEQHFGEAPKLSNEFASDAARLGIAQERIESTLAGFIDHHKSKGNRFADWRAAFRTWCRNDLKYSARNTGKTGGGLRNDATSVLGAVALRRYGLQRAERSSEVPGSAEAPAYGSRDGDLPI